MSFKCIIVLLILSVQVHAQINSSLIKDLIESVAENLPEDYDLSALEEHLTYLSKHPVNLNQTNKEELAKLPFLSALQITSFFKYIKEYGKLMNVLELQGIPNFDIRTVQNLLPFVTLNEAGLYERITLIQLRKSGENEILIRAGRVIEQQKGFKNLTTSHYLGSPERLLLRYKFTFPNRLSASLVMEKDAGERFLKGKNKLSDYQSAHVGLYHIGPFQKVIAGDYTLQFGQGLTLWSGFSFGKAPDVASVVKNEIGLKAYSSANEFSFFRGAATTVSYHRTSLTTFYSSRNLDANLTRSGEEETLTTITETGLHRTPTEIANQQRVNQKFYGAVLQLHQNNFNLGLIGHRTIFNKSFVTGSQVYQSFNYTGKQLLNAGFNYNYSFKNVFGFGEIAKSFPGGIAYINGALVSLSAKLSAVILNRNYQVDYYNFYQQSIAEGSQAANENGWYAGININLSKALTLSFFADYFRFPWLKFRVDAPSQGNEILGQLSYTPSKTTKFGIRYKAELKQRNTDSTTPINYLVNIKRESYRADISWQLHHLLKFQNRLELTQFKEDRHHASFGYLFYQDISYAPALSRFAINARLAYFQIQDYDNRIYAYEDDVLYSSTFGMYYGKGFRTLFNIKYKLAKKLDIWIRHALFYYMDTQKIGSGLDEISGNKKNDIKIQVRYQF